MSAETSTASVIGGRGVAGGELLRLLAGHPLFAFQQATSRQFANNSIVFVNPNLGGVDCRGTVGYLHPSGE